ncbi:MAG: ThiF family adenylyltransferase [Candidatus Lokiarchaeota archaeon]|nr:ThiF family adenylyltransferase [Candidatus Lokiarchaeota archaeon]
MGKELTQEEKEITKRQKLIEGWDQLALKNSTVFIAGVGALGCEIAKDLALCGVGKLILCDLDTIETSNLSRQMLFYKGDEGRPKAEVAAERVKRMNPFIEIQYYFKPIQELPMELYKSCDLIIAALDNFKARIDLNKICLDLKIPMIDGGTLGMEGHVQVIIPEGTVDSSGNLLEYGNQSRMIDTLTQNKLWELEESKYPGYFAAMRQIEELEEKIERLTSVFIEPVVEKIRTQTAKELQSHSNNNYTPCYRCAVPVPPPMGKMAAACTLKGIPRNRIQCALRAEVLYHNREDKDVDFSKMEEVQKLTQIAQKELDSLRTRVLSEGISPEEQSLISTEEMEERKKNIKITFGPDFSPEDMENILQNKMPAIQTVSSVIASIESQEALKILFRMKGIDVGEIMDPPYVNYNGVFGQFDAIPLSRRDDCVACGKIVGVENLSLLVPKDATFDTLFELIKSQKYNMNPDKWSISNPITKAYVYLPGNPKSPGLKDEVAQSGIESGTFYTFSTAPANAIDGIHTFNIRIEFAE